ncbi:sigma-70 family RNA polymerase sigma factor [Reyranella sp.]|uniref:sigma-70 family RNA polymerase sigma factor n=1 Tax=Reyranella sp. TaxID=1929291 RepID=UPI003BA9E1A9
MPQGDVTLEIFLAHRGALVNYASALTGDHGRAEDLVQEAWLRYRTASSDRRVDEPVGYLYRIVRNLALDLRRRLSIERRHVAASLDDAAGEGDGLSAEAALIAREDLRRIMAALDELPERTRIALEMHRLGGCKLKDVAAHLGLSISFTHALIKEGLKHCQRRL